MRVLFLSYNGLLEPILPSQAVPYLKGLAGHGHEFILLSYEKKSDLNKAGQRGISGLKERLKKDKIEWQYLRYHKSPPVLSTVFDLLAGAVRVFAIVRYRKIDILHVRGITPGMIALMLAKILRVKILFDMRGLLAEEYVGGGMWKEDSLQFRMVKKAEKKLLSLADAVTVLTQKHYDLNMSLDYIVRRDIPMEVIPCCVDTSRFSYPGRDDMVLRRQEGLEGKFVIMYPGKLGSFYFIDEMLEFFDCALKSIPDAVFFVITRDDPAALLRKAEALSIPRDKIFVKTGLSFEEMPPYMRIADAGVFFINPYKKFGSSPIKMGEFLASGVPVIINPGIGDTEELVRNNKVGVVVDDFTERSYGDSVSRLMALEPGCEDLKKRCRDTACRVLSLTGGVDKYNKIYNSLSRR